MHPISNNRSVVSKAVRAVDRQPSAPRSGILTRRELRRIVADLLG